MNALPYDPIIRAATAADADAIASLHAESWQRTYRGMMADDFLDHQALADRRRVWRERLGIAADGFREAAPDQFVAIAEIDSRIVGFVCAFARYDAHGSYIDNLHVARPYARRGIGAALMRSAADWLCDRAPDLAVYLWVMEANASARAFYDRLGGINAGTEIKRDPGGGESPNCRYVWETPQRLRRTALPSVRLQADRP